MSPAWQRTSRGFLFLETIEDRKKKNLSPASLSYRFLYASARVTMPIATPMEREFGGWPGAGNLQKRRGNQKNQFGIASDNGYYVNYEICLVNPAYNVSVFRPSLNPSSL
jgi:hypothetical protein